MSTPVVRSSSPGPLGTVPGQRSAAGAGGLAGLEAPLPSTRERVIAAAAQVFADKGFRRATVRAIVARAGVNLNAVNYHFGDKEGLYRAVWETLCSEPEVGDPFAEASGGLDPAVRLGAFVRAFLRLGVARRHESSPISRLMAMELAEPTAALDMLVERFIRPRFDLLAGIVKEIGGERLTPAQVELSTESILGQCVHMVHSRPIVSRLLPHVAYTPEGLDRMAEHIAAFSLAALRQAAGGGGRRSGRGTGDTEDAA